MTISAPVSWRTQPAPPKWSGWLWVTMTVCTRRSGMPALASRRSSSCERRPPGQAGVDDGDAALVLEHVAVDVAEAGHVDRQLAAQHARGDLGDLGGRPLLLLAAGAIGHRLDGVPDAASDAGRTVASATIGRWDGPCTPPGWTLGWLLLWSTRRLPPPTATRPAGRRRRAGPRRGGRAARTCSRRSSPSCGRATSSSSSTTTRPTRTAAVAAGQRRRRSSPRRTSRRAGSASRTPAGPGAAATTAPRARVPRRRRAAGPDAARRARRRRRRRPDAVVSVQPWHDAARARRAGDGCWPTSSPLMGSGGVHGARRGGCAPTSPSARCWP